VLGANPWFKKPRAIGEKVDVSGWFLKVAKIKSFMVIKTAD